MTIVIFQCFIFCVAVAHNENKGSRTMRIVMGLLATATHGIKLVIKAISDGFATVLKKRPNNDRFCVIMLITAFLLEMFTDSQWGNVFMYFRLKLGFKTQDFSRWFSLAGMVGLAGQFIFVPLFLKVLRFHDATISLLGK